MRMRVNRMLALIAAIVAGAVILLPISATADPITIDFETLPPGPSNFGPPPHTVTEKGATFSGGIILTNESASIDLTNVYGTVDCCGYSNPLSIVFDGVVSQLSVLITNNVNASYTLTDNLGRSVSASVPAFNTPLTLTLPFDRITAATVASVGIPGFDFALGSVSFISTPVPEPGSMLLVAGGIAAVITRRLRSRPTAD